jgi:hypothetical protein
MVDPILGLPELLEGDSLGYRRQNERDLILARLGVDCRIASAALTAPPGSVTRGGAWIVAGSGTGQWAGKAANTIAVALSDNPTSVAGWFFYVPQLGHRVWIIGTGQRFWDGSTWASY